MTVTVVHGDALDVLERMEPASVDAIVTDPPYLNTGTGSSRVSRSQAVPDERQFYERWMRDVWALMSRVLRHHGGLWMTVDWRGALAAEQASFRTDLKFGGVGVWDRGGLGMGYMLRHTHECFVVARKPGWKRVLTNEPDVWREPWSPGNRKEHEAEKPVSLMLRGARLLGVGPGWTVLDPFAGSGTTGVAAATLGAHAILVEREDEFVDLSERRTGPHAVD